MTTSNTSLNKQLLAAIKHPYQTALMPDFLLGKKKDIYTIIRIFLSSAPDELGKLKIALENKDDAETLSTLKTAILSITDKDLLQKKLAHYYGQSEHEKDLLEEIEKSIVKPLKVAFNHLSYQHNFDKRLTYRKEVGVQSEQNAATTPDEKTTDVSQKQEIKNLKNKTDAWSTALTILVAIGQAGIAATCFIVLGATTTLFLPIFIAAFITNFFLMKGDIKGLLKKIALKLKGYRDFMDPELTDGQLKLTYACLIFAVASGVTFGIMALTTSYGALMAILPAIGLGALAIPGIGWAIAGIIALATIPVLTALMFESMASFIKDFQKNWGKIKNYFSFSEHAKEKSFKQQCQFFLSRLIHVGLGAAAVGITFFAVISTFGSYTSNISQTLQSLFKVTTRLAHGLAIGIVFVCNMIPELIFNFKNVLTFFISLPKQFKAAVHRAKLVFNRELHPAAKTGLFLLLTGALFILSCVSLNGYGNGKTGSTPDGDGVSFLMKLFQFSPKTAALIGLVTSAGISAAANHLYSTDELNACTPVAAVEATTEQQADKQQECASVLAEQSLFAASSDNKAPSSIQEKAATPAP